MKKLLLTLVALVACTASWAQVDVSTLTSYTSVTTPTDPAPLKTDGTYYLLKFNTGGYVRCDGNAVSVNNDARIDFSDVFRIVDRGDGWYSLINKEGKYIGYNDSGNVATVVLYDSEINESLKKTTPVQFSNGTNGILLARDGGVYKFFCQSGTIVKYIKKDASTTDAELIFYEVPASMLVEPMRDINGNAVVEGKAYWLKANGEYIYDYTDDSNKIRHTNASRKGATSAYIWYFEKTGGGVAIKSAAGNYLRRLGDADKVNAYGGGNLHADGATAGDGSVWTYETAPEYPNMQAFYVNKSATHAGVDNIAYLANSGAHFIGLSSTGISSEGSRWEIEPVSYYEDLDAAALGIGARKDEYYTQYVTLKVGDREAAQTDGILQADYRSKIYWDRTDYRFVCYPGATITAGVDKSHMNAMHAFCFIDEDGNGKFTNTVSTNTSGIEVADPASELKTWSGLKNGDSWYNSEGTKTDANRLDMPSFTAPSTPGVYRMRYMLSWNNKSPVGFASIASQNGIIADVTLDVREAIDLTVKDGWGYATFYNSASNMEIPSGCVPYTLSEGTEKIVSSTVTGAIPAGTAVVIKAAAGTYTLYPTLTAGTAASGNLLKGTDTDTEVTAATGKKQYTLGLGTKNLVGMYEPASSPFTNPAHEAYLELTEDFSATVASFYFTNIIDGVAVGIETIENEAAKGACYDLSGRRMNSRPASGFYIINGKKAIVK